MISLYPRLAVSLILLALGSPLSAQTGPGAMCASYPPGAASHQCTCPPGPYAGAVWGSGPYTADSDLCSAARHAGVIGDQGGPVTANSVAPPASYAGTVSNGVTSQDWGSYDAAYVFKGAAAQVGMAACGTLGPFAVSTCACPAGGADAIVWGSDPYTADSDICTAARHAGVIGPEGGEVTVRRMAGQPDYTASTANGITSQAYGSYGASFTFVPKN
jgi:hypothetical protein